MSPGIFRGMRDIQMDGKKREGSPSTGASGTSPKRRKMTDSLDPSLTDFPVDNAQAMNESFPNKLHIAVSRTHLDEISAVINNLFDEERQILKDEAESYKLANENLKLRLAESAKCCQEAKAAQVAAEAEISQLRTEMDQRITELLHKNSELEKRMIDQATQDTAKLIAVADKIIELQREIKTSAVSQEKLSFDTKQLQEANVKILKLESDQKSLWQQMQDLLPSVAWIKKVGKQLQSVKDSNETPREAFKEEIFTDEMTFSDHKISNDAEFFNQQFVAGKCNLPPVVAGYYMEDSKDICHQTQQKKTESHQECGDLWAKKEEITKTKADDDFEFSRNDSSLSFNEDLPKKILKIDRSMNFKSDNDRDEVEKNQRIWVDELYVLASDPTFFEIDWETLYEQNGRCQFECSDCGEVKTTRSDVQDHIWIKHYGGQLRCPLCPDRSVTFSRRFRIKRHMAMMHSD